MEHEWQWSENDGTWNCPKCGFSPENEDVTTSPCVPADQTEEWDLPDIEQAGHDQERMRQ